MLGITALIIEKINMGMALAAFAFFLLYYILEYIRPTVGKISLNFLIIDISLPVIQFLLIISKKYDEIFLLISIFLYLFIFLVLISIAQDEDILSTLIKKKKQRINEFFREFFKKYYNSKKSYIPLPEWFIFFDSYKLYSVIMIFIVFIAFLIFNFINRPLPSLIQFIFMYVLISIPYYLFLYLLWTMYEDSQSLINFSIESILSTEDLPKISIYLELLRIGLLKSNFGKLYFINKNRNRERYTGINNSFKKLRKIIFDTKLYGKEGDLAFLDLNLKNLENNLEFKDFVRFCFRLEKKYNDREISKLEYIEQRKISFKGSL